MFFARFFSWICFQYIVIDFFKCEGLTFLPKHEYNVTLQVNTKNGIVQGKERRTVKKTTYFSYEGIPFAQPPILNLRFKNPKPAKPWKNVLNATEPNPGCIELRIRFIRLELPGDEDCLYLNVYTPTNMQHSKDLLPVIVWIYGGAFLEGNSVLYGEAHLIDINVVVVTMNYRLGAFGFLSTEDEASPGNYGLKDQNAALQWVNQNIDRFGGDPKKVTIAGHSAGSASVIYHMLSPKSRGLFARAVAWSGETTSVWINQKSPKTIAMDLALNLGIKTNDTTEMMDKLRKINVEYLKNGQAMVTLMHGINILSDGVTFSPTIEPNNPEAFITESSYDLIKRGDFARVPLIIGMTTMEFGFFSRIYSILRPLLIIFDLSPSFIPNGMHFKSFLKNREIGQKITEKYFESKSFSGATDEELTKFFTDLIYTVPVTRTIRAMSSYIPLYFFVSAHPEKLTKHVIKSMGYPIDTNTRGVVHGEDIPLIWYYKHFGTPPKSIVIHKKFLQMWKNFAITGNPTPSVDPKLGIIWPPVTDNKNISFMLIQDDVKIAYNYKKKFTDFWDRTLNE